jgi:hypothetical protein
MKKIYIHLVLTWSILTFSLQLPAQVGRIVLPGEAKHQTIVTEPLTMRKGFLRAGLVYSSNYSDKQFDGNGKRTGFGNMISNHTGFFSIHSYYGLTDKFELYINIPYENTSLYTTVEFHYENNIQVHKWSQHCKGFGDMSAGLSYRLNDQNGSAPSILLGVIANLPTGKKNPSNIIDENNYDRPTGEGDHGFLFQAIARKVVYPYSLGLNASFRVRTGGEKIMTPGEFPVSFRNGNLYSISNSSRLHLNDWIVLANYLDYSIFGKNMVDDVIADENSWILNTAPYLYFQIRQLRLVQGMNVPLLGKNIIASPSYYITVQLTI